MRRNALCREKRRPLFVSYRFAYYIWNYRPSLDAVPTDAHGAASLTSFTNRFMQRTQNRGAPLGSAPPLGSAARYYSELFHIFAANRFPSASRVCGFI